jgi:N-acetyl-anhydromuramyl-L-alanine amidase AmpD
MNLRKLIFTNNRCYKAGKSIKPKGIMVHSTGANNPNLKRYVGPDDGKLGKNLNGNHWNKSNLSVCVHAFIGKLKDGSIATYQVLPWNHRAWHCGSSGNNTHISFEICEDGLKDKKYFSKVYQEAVELCVYLCKKYDLTEKDIICHSEGYKKGIASNHGDVMHWFPKHGKSMDTFRADVKDLLKGDEKVEEPAKPTTTAEKYNLTQFIKDVQKACGAAVDGIAGKETLSKTVTLSATKNRKHKAVKPVQKRLYALGYTEIGEADGVAGAKFTKAVKRFQKENGYVADGEITAVNKTWRKLLGMK